MLFNSYEFIFIFCPIVFFGYFKLGKIDAQRPDSNFANIWLTVSSLFFYGWWDFRFLPLLVGSILTNYFIAGKILDSRPKDNPREKNSSCKIFFLLGLAFNVGLLGYFKYLDFLLENLNGLGAGFELMNLILPLGISFFTITQLLYLFDCYEGTTKDHSLINYSLFVSFFPHLMAGPILYHRQMMTQFRDKNLRLANFDNIAHGLTLFIIGLSKKVLIADELSPYIQAGYSSPEELTTFAAWLTAISYMLQLYFDFSGYSDMAVGLSRMMNLEIPINFNSPYRATGMINFWQRWHISLTNAITACVYMPIVRRLKTRTVSHTIIASFIAFFIVGIWHGAGWTFVIFALMNSLGVIVNYLWKYKKFSMPKIPAHIITLLFVMTTMVFFRANSVDDALTVLAAMFGANGTEYPRRIVEFMMDFGVSLTVGNVPGLLPKFEFVTAILLAAFCPNSNELVKNFKPNYKWAAIITLLFAWAILAMTKPTEFLYFQF